MADSSPKPAQESVSSVPPPEKDKTKVTGSEKRDADEAHSKELAQGSRVDTSKPLETVLLMEAPTSKKSEEHHLPHLHAPPYVHHFDTYSLVKDLEKGNFTEEQSITLMKAVRGLLAVNLDVAKEGLVSKSDVENVYQDNCISPPDAFANSTVLGDLSFPCSMLGTTHRDSKCPKIIE